MTLKEFVKWRAQLVALEVHHWKGKVVGGGGLYVD